MTERHENFDNWLNELYEPVSIGDLKFYAADIIAKCDPTAYRIWATDWNDEQGVGECDTCGAEYETSSREGRCGDCGECAEHCDHDEEETD